MTTLGERYRLALLVEKWLVWIDSHRVKNRGTQVLGTDRVFQRVGGIAV